MRIVLVTPEYPPAPSAGGIATYTATIARALARDGHAVRVVAPGTAERTERATEAGVDVVRLRHRWIPERRADRVIRAIRTARAAHAFRADVIQSVEWEANAWWIARRSSTPLVTRLATPTYLVEELNRGRPSDDSAFVRALERDQTRRGDAVFAPSRALAERVARDWDLPDERLHVIPTPIDVDDVRRIAAETTPRFDPTPPFIAFVGRLERRKGIAELGVALAAALRRYPDHSAVLIGRDAREDGGMVMQTFREQTEDVADRVHVLGELPRAEALAIMSRARIVTLPSRWENFANAALEALALGRPVIATRVGGFGELLHHDRDAWLVPPGDADALERELLQRLGDEAGLRRVGEAARDYAETFRPDRIADQLVALYTDVAAERRRTFGRDIYARGYRKYFDPDSARDPFRDAYRDKLTSVREFFDARPPSKILDVGGGYGRLAGPLMERHDVTLADISPEMVSEARRRWPELRTVEADAAALPFADESFDAVVALDLMPHVQDLRHVVHELKRVSRSGGSVVFDTTNASAWWVPLYPSYVNWQPKRLLVTMRSRGVLPEWRSLVQHHRPKDVARVIADAGLALQRTERFGRGPVPKWSLWWTAKP